VKATAAFSIGSKLCFQVLMAWVVLVFGSLAFAQPLRVLMLDFDDTIMSTTAKIYVYNKKTGSELGFSTADFAEAGEVIGKPGPYQDYEFRGPEEIASFRDFRDQPGRNVFLERMLEAIETRPTHLWQGPSWNDFVEAMSTQEGAQTVYINTARGNSPRQMLEAFEHLRKLGFFRFGLVYDHLIAVNAPEWKALGLSVEETKAVAMKRVLDQLQARVESAQLQSEQRREGKTLRGEFLFVDDDFQNVEKAKKALEPHLPRWPAVDVRLSYVGRVRPNTDPFTVRLKLATPACRGIF